MTTIDYKILNNLATYLNVRLQNELIKQGHFATDALYNSLNVYVEHTVNSINIVGSALHYAKYVENGRNANAKGVPIDALVDWIRAKKIELNGKRERSIAFAMQIVIKEKGIKPAHFIQNVLTRNDNKIDRDVTRFISTMIDDTINEIFRSNKN